MALTKTVKTPQGVNADYHKIIKIEYSVVDSTMLVVLAIYASAEARDEGAVPLWHEYINVPFEKLDADPRESIYEFLSAYEGSWMHGAQRDPRPDPVAEEPITPVVEEYVGDGTAVPGDANYRA